MHRNNTIIIISLILLVSFGWAILANQAINSLSDDFEPEHVNLFRVLNNTLVITLVFTTMYALIRKQRKRLKAAGEHYGRLFENIPAPMFIYDAATYKFLATNKAAELQYGYTKEEFLALTPANMRVEGELKSLHDVNERFATKNYRSACWLHGDKFGNSFYVCVYTCDTVFNGKSAKQAMVINIDEKVKAELALKEKQLLPDITKSEIKNTPIPHLA
ncbi:MAG: PAS domain S-box protein [Bacteroidetes bacterium]|nr:PAS domain S-box protein [Bacteroidota bacterium]